MDSPHQKLYSKPSNKCGRSSEAEHLVANQKVGISKFLVRSNKTGRKTMNTLILVGVGVVIGTFIPMPQQTLVRNAISAAWNWAKTKLSSVSLA